MEPDPVVTGWFLNMTPGLYSNGDVRGRRDPIASRWLPNMIPGQHYTGDIRDDLLGRVVRDRETRTPLEKAVNGANEISGGKTIEE